MNQPTKKPHRVDTQRTVYTFAYLSNASWHALEEGKRKPTGSFLQWMTASVFAAFSLEAYLNHLGSIRFRCWKRIERSLPVEAKLALILEDLHQEPDFGSRPFQTINDLFRFRNQLAHGKTEQLTASEIHMLSPGERPEEHELLASWEPQCNQKTATRFHDDVCVVITQLHSWAGLDTLFLFSPSRGKTRISAEHDETTN